MAATLLTEAEQAALPQQLPLWQVSEGKLQREFRFADFSEAFGFMTRVALAAELMGHHPDWSNVYNQVSIALVTHDLGGISSLDRSLAERIDVLAGQR
ncbi:MAG: 4a-hydroxytetrahydrobiopterin dehydratase [Synechococcus sp.]|nr:4a-hydroxytetrahydrobiopterin dehydratase [Synechococcus sp.]